MMRFLSSVKRMPVVRTLYQLPFFLRPYHFLLSFFAAWWYGFPSKHLTVIGVTGTKGKTTTANIIAQLFQGSGRPAGLATTVNFAIGEREWANETKQTMLGRFALQAFLRDIVRAGCRYAVIETSSEGILQYRHRFIAYDAAVFTNLSPEHIERHGSFENYRAAKTKLFARTAKSRESIGIYNLDDENVGYFLRAPMKRKIGFTLKNGEAARAAAAKGGVNETLPVTEVTLGIAKTRFHLNGDAYEMPLVGEFNVANAAAAIATAHAYDVPPAKIEEILRHIRPVPGRFEVINEGQPFTVIVDYAHEPASLSAAYRTVKLFEPRRVIGILGAQGGGRDKWKRAAMGRIAAEYCNEIILTNEDPYDDDPEEIMDDIEKGILEYSQNFRPVYKISDRREAIRHALLSARPGDAVIMTGKGGEQWMCVERGRKIVWNERLVVEELIHEHAGKIITTQSSRGASSPREQA